MNEVYVIVSYYFDGSSKPDVDFAVTSDGALHISTQKAGNSKQVTVYRITDGISKLVTGVELRTVGENQKKENAQ